MKKLLILVLAVTLIASFAAMVGAKIVGTPHDLAPEPCAMCHTPHNATGDYPLWNRIQGGQTYTMYDSTSFDMNEGNTAPYAPSSLCLICHNGVASTLSNYPGPCSTPDALYDYDMPDNACGMIGTPAGVAHDLTNDHPISFTYNPSLDTVNDNNGFPGTTTIGTRNWIIGAYSGEQFPLYVGGPTGIAVDQFECATCHSVHDTIDYPDKGSLQVYFLRADNTGSTMCQDCHVNR